MKYIFTPTGQVVLESLSFTKTLYAFDFDGTLAPIVKEPDAAKLPTLTAKLLNELSAIAPVAIVSGRSLNDLENRLENMPCHLIGNHGLEGLASHSESINHAKNLCITWRDQLERNWRDLRPDTGVFLEDKGFSIALHYRQSRNKKTAKAKLFEKIGDLAPSPRVILGKSVINLVPPGAPHKDKTHCY
jgi:trehalose 6-phosphate phosphatase